MIGRKTRKERQLCHKKYIRLFNIRWVFFRIYLMNPNPAENLLLWQNLPPNCFISIRVKIIWEMDKNVFCFRFKLH